MGTPGFVVPCTERRQGRDLAKLLKAPGFTEWEMSTGFNVQPPVTLALTKTLSSEARHRKSIDVREREAGSEDGV